jgi:hypothetical protein
VSFGFRIEPLYGASLVMRLLKEFGKLMHRSLRRRFYDVLHLAHRVAQAFLLVAFAIALLVSTPLRSGETGAQAVRQLRPLKSLLSFSRTQPSCQVGGEGAA